jgi:spore germination cell wall hydrolase CwlJ-like protein
MKRDIDAPFYALTPAQVTALIAWAEARGEGADGQIAVMWAIENRVNKGGWFLDTGIEADGLSPYHAVALKNALVHGTFIYQFSCLSEKDPNRQHMLWIANNAAIDTLIMTASADQIIKGEISDPTNGGTYYYNPDACTPTWSNTFTETAVIGHHRFMRG